ncbi:MAG: hypothetical protein AB1Z51_08250 [Desulfuromonadales bacterium]
MEEKETGLRVGYARVSSVGQRLDVLLEVVPEDFEVLKWASVDESYKPCS